MSEAEELVAKTRSVYKTGRTKSTEWRLKQLQKLHKMLTDHENDFIEALRQDLKKPSFETMVSEIYTARCETSHAINHLKSWVQPHYPSKTLVQAVDTVYTQPEPYGVVLVLGAWNYPIYLSIAPLIGAIAAGNCVILKPSEVAEESAKLLAKLLPKYLDSECFPVYQGAVQETTELLKQKFDYIFFTGNKNVGKIVMQAAAKYLTPVTLELGGKCPAYIHKHSDIKIVASRLAWGKLMNCGQTCVAPDYVLCDDELVKDFITQYGKKVKERYGEDPQKSPDLTRIINKRHFKRLQSILEQTPKENIVLGGQMDEDDLYIAPTIVTNCTVDDAVMQDELFGPILPIIPVKNKEEAVDIMNQFEQPLALYVFSKDKQVVSYITSNSPSGGVTVNDTVLHMCSTNLPFGGVGPSGMGAYHGKFSFDTFSHKRSVCYRGQTMEKLVESRYPPYTSMKLKQSKFLIEEKPGSWSCSIQ